VVIEPTLVKDPTSPLHLLIKLSMF